MNPYPVPFELPDDPLELAELALKRMAVDLQNKLSVFEVRISVCYIYCGHSVVLFKIASSKDIEFATLYMTARFT